MITSEEMEFWLKKRGKDYPLVTYHGGAMKAYVTFELPLDEISEHYGVDKIKIGDKVYSKVK